MSFIRLLMELLEQGVDIKISLKLSPDVPLETISLKCSYPQCEFVTRGHKNHKSAERALRSHQNQCIHKPELGELMDFIDQMHANDDENG